MPASDLRFPIGRWSAPADREPATIARLIDTIAAAPDALRAAVADLDDAQLDTPYRDGGWTVRQVVHHVADSHLHAYLRCKLAATEDAPRIAAYAEGAWATLADVQLEPAVSLALVDALHRRWATFLRALSPEALDRPYAHPEMGLVPVRTALAIYAWHGAHHTAHVTELRRRMGW